jgi:hypothetical protein
MSNHETENYRVVLLRTQGFDDLIFIQKRVFWFIWRDVCQIKGENKTWDEQLDKAHTELLNYIEYEV